MFIALAPWAATTKHILLYIIHFGTLRQALLHIFSQVQYLKKKYKFLLIVAHIVLNAVPGALILFIT